ncbi:MAG: cupin domain-containing protein [Candidatus Hodarchaeales archaeon]|jgi:quercetin dioxygenase-like cupin family protein
MSEIKEHEVVTGFKGQFIHTENLTIAHWSITAGSILPEHKHHQEQVTNLIKGEFEMHCDEKNVKLESGGVVVIPSNALHSGKALTDCYIVDVFYPTREDYREE